MLWMVPPPELCAPQAVCPAQLCAPRAVYPRTVKRGSPGTAHGEMPHPGHRCVLQRLSSSLALLTSRTYYCEYFWLTDVALKYREALGFYVTVL